MAAAQGRGERDCGKGRHAHLDGQRVPFALQGHGEGSDEHPAGARAADVRKGTDHQGGRDHQRQGHRATNKNGRYYLYSVVDK